MGKYMRKSKTTGEVVLMDVSQSSLGVRTRAKTLALQRLQKSVGPPPSTASGGSYIQLRSRRLEKPPILVTNADSKRQKHLPKRSCGPNPNSGANSRLKVGSGNSGSVPPDSRKQEERQSSEREKVADKEEEIQENNKNETVDLGNEASFGENVLEFEGRERSTRETTPCSLIRDPETVRTPGSTTKPKSSTEDNRRAQNSMLRPIPTEHEMNEFFTGAEEQQQRQFIEKYNFDPVNDKPLPGRYEWVKVDPKRC